MQRHQLSHGCKTGPARHGVVADVDHAAHLELATHKINNHLPIFGADPAEDSVQADVVEVWQIRAIGEVSKCFVKKLHVAA